MAERKTYREEAAALRDQSARIRDRELRATMLEIAERYDRLAQLLELQNMNLLISR